MALNFSQLSVCLYGYKPSWIIKRNFLSQPQYRLVWLKFFLVAFYLDLFCFASLTLQCNLHAKNIYQLISPLYLLHWISLVSQKWWYLYLSFFLWTSAECFYVFPYHPFWSPCQLDCDLDIKANMRLLVFCSDSNIIFVKLFSTLMKR